jgi:hypothetical protein
MSVWLKEHGSLSPHHLPRFLVFMLPSGAISAPELPLLEILELRFLWRNIYIFSEFIHFISLRLLFGSRSPFRSLFDCWSVTISCLFTRSHAIFGISPIMRFSLVLTRISLLAFYSSGYLSSLFSCECWWIDGRWWSLCITFSFRICDFRFSDFWFFFF